MYTLTYRGRRGAVITTQLTGVEAAKRLQKLNAEANLCDDQGQKVGGVQDWAGRRNDRRMRWVFWYDTDIEKQNPTA